MERITTFDDEPNGMLSTLRFSIRERELTNDVVVDVMDLEVPARRVYLKGENYEIASGRAYSKIVESTRLQVLDNARARLKFTFSVLAKRESN